MLPSSVQVAAFEGTFLRAVCLFLSLVMQNAVSLSGGNAVTLVKNLEEIKEKRAILFQEKEDKDYYLSQNISRRKLLEKGGVEKDDERVEDSQVAYKEALINYGNYL